MLFVLLLIVYRRPVKQTLILCGVSIVVAFSWNIWTSSPSNTSGQWGPTFSGEKRDRTCGLLNTIEAHSQARLHTPVTEPESALSSAGNLNVEKVYFK